VYSTAINCEDKDCFEDDVCFSHVKCVLHALPTSCVQLGQVMHTVPLELPFFPDATGSNGWRDNAKKVMYDYILEMRLSQKVFADRLGSEEIKIIQKIIDMCMVA